MSFSQLPLCSSKQIVAAIRRLGARPGKTKHGSHASYNRTMPDGRTLTAVVILGRKEVPKSTLQRILRSLEIMPEEFTAVLR